VLVVVGVFVVSRLSLVVVVCKFFVFGRSRSCGWSFNAMKRGGLWCYSDCCDHLSHCWWLLESLWKFV
jgi:hypothetical protein